MNKVILLVLVLVTTVSFGQRGNREKIKSLKIAFITDRLELTGTEAEKFWPVYNSYEVQRESLRQKERSEIREKIKDVQTLSETEAKNLLKQFTEFKATEEELNTDYLNDIKKVLSAKKTLLLLSSEEEFKRRLLKQYRQNRGGRR